MWEEATRGESFSSDHDALVRQVVLRLGSGLIGPSPAQHLLRGLRMKSWPDLGTSNSSTLTQNNHEMPPRLWSNLWPWRRHCQLKTWHLQPVTTSKISVATAVGDLFGTAWKEFRVEVSNKALFYWEILAEQAFRYPDIFRGRFHQSNFFHLLFYLDNHWSL